MVNCPECSEEIEPMDSGDDDGGLMCPDCGAEFTADALVPKKEGYVCGVILVSEAVKKNKKLTKLTLDVGPELGEITVVTNAKHCTEGRVVVVATVGATVGDQEDDGFVVKKAPVGGVASEGMLCDCPMLGWTGGAKGQAIFLSSEEYSAGAPPPASRPRKEES